MHSAGEIVEVSPSEAKFLISVGSAEYLSGAITAEAEVPEKKTVAKTTTRKKK